jgi:hypothetical protein
MPEAGESDGFGIRNSKILKARPCPSEPRGGWGFKSRGGLEILQNARFGRSVEHCFARIIAISGGASRAPAANNFCRGFHLGLRRVARGQTQSIFYFGLIWRVCVKGTKAAAIRSASGWRTFPIFAHTVSLWEIGTKVKGHGSVQSEPLKFNGLPREFPFTC